MIKNEYVTDAIKTIEIETNKLLPIAKFQFSENKDEWNIAHCSFMEYSLILQRLRTKLKTLVKRNKITQNEVEFIENQTKNARVALRANGWKFTHSVKDTNGHYHDEI